MFHETTEHLLNPFSFLCSNPSKNKMFPIAKQLQIDNNVNQKKTQSSNGQHNTCMTCL